MYQFVAVALWGASTCPEQPECSSRSQRWDEAQTPPACSREGVIRFRLQNTIRTSVSKISSSFLWHTGFKRHLLHTDVDVLESVCRDSVIHIFVVEEMERLEGVEDEISQILVHVDGEDPAVEAVYRPAPIHHLGGGHGASFNHQKWMNTSSFTITHYHQTASCRVIHSHRNAFKQQNKKDFIHIQMP